MAQHVHPRAARALMLLAFIAASACAPGTPAGVDAALLTANGTGRPLSTQDSDPTPNPDPGPALAGNTPGSSNNATTPTPTSTPASTNGDSALAVVTPHTVPANYPLINLSPRLSPNECLDILNAKPTTGLPLQLYYCNGIDAAQGWQYTRGQLQIDTSWCLDVSSADPNKATNAILNTCDTSGGRPGQFWNFVDGMLQVAGTNVCLTLADTNATIDKYMLVAACDPNNPQQQWAVDKWSTTGAIGVSIGNQTDLDVCADIYAGKTAPGAVVDRYTCNRTGAQQWVWQRRSLQALGQCLEAENTAAAMQPCDGANRNQAWVTDHGRIKLFGSNTCLDLSTSSAADATPLTMNPCSDAQSQQWIWGVNPP